MATDPKSTAREFVLAIIAGDAERVRKLHAAGTSVTETDQYGWLPIHSAAANNRDAIIRLLIEWGSPIEATGTEMWTPLHVASVSRSHRAVSALLKARANIHARSIFGQTPLHLAVGPTITEALLDTVNILVSAGADPNSTDHDGKTPLSEAREIGDPALVKIIGKGVCR